MIPSLLALAKALRETGEGEVTLGVWAKAAMAALVSLRKYTPAQPGDRTLVDALQPCIISLAEDGNIGKAAKAAREGAESTRGMTASLGRSVYVGDVGDIPDPGAIGIAVLMEGLAEVVC